MGKKIEGFFTQCKEITSAHILYSGSHRDLTFLITELPKDPEKNRTLPVLISELVNQNILIPRGEKGEGFYSHGFMVSKPSVKCCLILNLKPLNKTIRYKRFQMESIFMVRALLQQDCYMTKLYLRDAYLYVLIRSALNIGSVVHHFQCKALPLSLSLGQTISSKVLEEALAPLRLHTITAILYLNDLFVMASSQTLLMRDILYIQQWLRKLGMLCNLDKSMTIPSQGTFCRGKRF